MLIDFCHHSVKPRVKCDKVSFDGYEVTNLTSANPVLKNKGFISDHFIKPPVNIIMQFPCNISIYRIVIDPVIGQQQSCDLKLFTSSHQSGQDQWLSGDSTEQRDFKTDGLLFNFIGSSSQSAPVLTCYQNNQFQDRGIWNREGMEDVKAFPATFELRGKRPHCLINVSHLSVNIVRTKWGKAVAIKRIEVWGMPSRNVPDRAQQLLRLAYQKCACVVPGTEDSHGKHNQPQTPHNAKGEMNQNESNSLKSDVWYGDLSVPDDFVDQITFEIMAVPILLPCGKNIDQSTLERFVNGEACWGRHPSDPFTGVPFGQGKQAVPNAALKARIDQFVTQHSQILNVPRTLGKGQKSTQEAARFSSIVSAEYFQGNSLNKNSITTSNDPAPFKNKLYSRKRKFDQQKSTENYVSKKNCPGDLATHHTICDKKKINNSKTAAAKLKTKPSEMDHSKSLSSSLESALMSTLHTLPSYTKCTKPSEESSVEPATQGATCCKCFGPNKTTVYRLPCGHFICRVCLTKGNEQVVCGSCLNHFNSRDIVRVFV